MLREDHAWEVLPWFCLQGEGIPASVTVRFGGERVSLCILSAVRKRSSQSETESLPCFLQQEVNHKLWHFPKGWFHSAVSVETCAARRVCSAVCQEDQKQIQLPPV